MGKAKSIVKDVSGYSTFKSVAGMAKGMINPDMPQAPAMQSPKPVAPATQQDANVSQAKDDQRRKMAGRTGRSQSSILDPSQALSDEEKDILG